jgi:hypothetical protein
MAAYDLTTLSKVREYLQIPSAQTDQDALISTLITQASTLIMRYTGREFAPTSTSTARKFMYRYGAYVPFAPYDLRSVDSVQIDTDTSTPTTLTTDNYRLLPITTQTGTYTGMQLRSMRVAPKSSVYDYENYREVTVAGSWGFSTIPDDVIIAANILVGWLFRNHSTIPGMGMESDGQRFGPTLWPTSVKQILEPYKSYGFGLNG